MKKVKPFSCRSLLWLLLFPLLMLSQRASAEEVFEPFDVIYSGTGYAFWEYDTGPALIDGDNVTQILVGIDTYGEMGYPFSLSWGDGTFYSSGDLLVDENGETVYTDEGFIAGYTPNDEITCWISFSGYNYYSAELKICSHTDAWYGKPLFVDFNQCTVVQVSVNKREITSHYGNCDLASNYYLRVLPFGVTDAFEEYTDNYADDNYVGYYYDSYYPYPWEEPMSNQNNMQRISRETPEPWAVESIYFIMDPHFDVTILNNGQELTYERVVDDEDIPEIWNYYCQDHNYDRYEASEVLYRITSPIDINDIIDFRPRYIGGDPIITFADATAKSLCVNKWDADGDGELSEIEAGMVGYLGTTFKESKIKSFDELRYFTSLFYIDNQAFYACKSLKSVTIPESVYYIYKQAFYTCYSLTNCKMPTTQDIVISDEAFYACTQLSDIDLLRVTSFGKKSFYYCKKLSSVTFSRRLSYVGSLAFASIPLTTVKAKRPFPSSLPKDAFSASVFENATLLVPRGYAGNYQSKDYWSKFGHIDTFMPNIQVAGTSIQPFGTCDLTVNLADNENFRGFQMDVTLPADLTLTQVTPLFRYAFAYNIVNEEVSSGAEGRTYRILCYPKTSYYYDTSDSNELLLLTLQSDGSVDNTIETITLSNIVISDSKSSESINLGDLAVDIEVGAAPAFLAGDVDMDGRHTAADLVGIINYLMGHVQGIFNARNADADQSGLIDITDVTLIVNKILRSGGKLTTMAHAPAMASEDGLSISYGDGVQVEVTGAERFVASQMDITLEDGMTLTDVESMDGHLMSWSQTGENSYRIVSYSFTNEVYPNAPLFTLKVEGNGSVSVSDALFVTPDGRSVMMNGVQGGVNGIADMTAGNSQAADIYTLGGVLVRRQATNLEGLAPGIYIMNGKKVVWK